MYALDVGIPWVFEPCSSAFAVYETCRQGFVANSMSASFQPTIAIGNLLSEFDSRLVGSRNEAIGAVVYARKGRFVLKIKNEQGIFRPRPRSTNGPEGPHF